MHLERLMSSYPESEAILRHNSDFITGGVVSTNRAVDPPIVFKRGKGALLWDVADRTLIDVVVGIPIPNATFEHLGLKRCGRRVDDHLRVVDGANELNKIVGILGVSLLAHFDG